MICRRRARRARGGPSRPRRSSPSSRRERARRGVVAFRDARAAARASRRRAISARPSTGASSSSASRRTSTKRRRSPICCCRRTRRSRAGTRSCRRPPIQARRSPAPGRPPHRDSTRAISSARCTPWPARWATRLRRRVRGRRPRRSWRPSSIASGRCGAARRTRQASRPNGSGSSNAAAGGCRRRRRGEEFGTVTLQRRRLGRSVLRAGPDPAKPDAQERPLVRARVGHRAPTGGRTTLARADGASREWPVTVTAFTPAVVNLAGGPNQPVLFELLGQPDSAPWRVWAELGPETARQFGVEHGANVRRHDSSRVRSTRWRLWSKRMPAGMRRASRSCRRSRPPDAGRAFLNADARRAVAARRDVGAGGRRGSHGSSREDICRAGVSSSISTAAPAARPASWPASTRTTSPFSTPDIADAGAADDVDSAGAD